MNVCSYFGDLLAWGLETFAQIKSKICGFYLNSRQYIKNEFNKTKICNELEHSEAAF
jgi:hypothetical protein